MELAYQEEMCEKLIQVSFAKIVNSKTERGGARLHKNLLILHLLQKARLEQRNRVLHDPSAMDTTNYFNEYRSPETEAAAQCESGQSVGNGDWPSQMQTGRLMDEQGDDREARGDKIEIDGAPERPGIVRGSEEMYNIGTMSTCSYNLTSPCLSSPATSGFDENGRRGTLVSERTYSAGGQQPLPRQSNGGVVGNAPSFDFSNQLDKTQGRELESISEPVMNETGSRRVVRQSSGPAKHKHPVDERGLRQPNDKHRSCYRGSKRCSASTDRKRAKTRKKYSSSSSDGSDEWSSSSEDDSLVGPMAEGEVAAEVSKPRDCMKRKLDESSTSDPVSSRDWYSSPKIACLTHGVSARSVSSDQHHQNLNGLISVFQSAALTSSDTANSVPNDDRGDDAQLALAAGMYDEGKGDSLPLTRSISCPGLMELACES